MRVSRFCSFLSKKTLTCREKPNNTPESFTTCPTRRTEIAPPRPLVDGRPEFRDVQRGSHHRKGVELFISVLHHPSPALSDSFGFLSHEGRHRHLHADFGLGLGLRRGLGTMPPTDYTYVEGPWRARCTQDQRTVFTRRRHPKPAMFMWRNPIPAKY
jgi:hypothetical protein